MAHVDLSSGKIYGCAPGSLTWLHEKGHLHYNKKDWGQKLYASRVSFQDLALVFVVLAVVFPWIYFNLAALVSIVAWGAIYLFEEAYAWAYAFRKHK